MLHQRLSLRTSARATESNSAPSRETREMDTKMVLGWMVGKRRRKEDQPGDSGSEPSPQTTAVAVGVAEVPATAVVVRVGVPSVPPEAGVNVGWPAPPSATVGESPCSTTDVRVGEEGSGDTAVVVGVRVGVEVDATVAVNDGVTVGSLVDVGLGVLVGANVGVAVGVTVAVGVEVASAPGIADLGPESLSGPSSRTSSQ
jgi:hypothetical protein